VRGEAGRIARRTQYMESQWPELWKLISDVRPEHRDLFFGSWELICRGDCNPGMPESYVLDEDKAKKVFCDEESEWCLDWTRASNDQDDKGLRYEVCDLLKIWTDEHEAEALAKNASDAQLARG